MASDQPGLVSEDRSIVVRAAWFLLVGWWATGIWLSVAWLLLALVVTIPLGIKMINLVPVVLSLKPPARAFVDRPNGGTVQSRPQRSLVVRAVWFLLVGWWASAIWTAVAYAFTLSIVGLPVAIWMYGKLPAIVSLYRY